jgi:predicted dehydrogenase
VNVMAKFRSGIEATMLFSGVAAHAPTDKLWLFGSEGTLSYDFNTDDLQLGKRGGKLESIPIPTEMQRSWTVERDFIAAVRDPSAPRPRPDFGEGMNYMRVVHCCVGGDGGAGCGESAMTHAATRRRPTARAPFTICSRPST